MPSAHAPPAASNARASSSRRKATMVGVAPPAAFSAPEPEPAAQPASQPLPRFDAPSPQVGGGSSFRDRLKARVESGPVIARPPASAPEQPAPMPSAPPPALDARRAPEARVSHPPPPDDVEWLVAITEENQRELTTQQIVSLYLAGTIDPETFIWKDGMDDWATPWEIEPIAAALRARGAAQPDTVGQSPAGPFAAEDDNPTVVGDAPRDFFGFDDEDEVTRVVGPVSEAISGVWREPGRVREPPVAHASAADPEVGFDDVTVSMAERESQALVRAAAHSDPSDLLDDEDNDEPTVAFAPSPLSEPPPPRPAAGTPAVAPSSPFAALRAASQQSSVPPPPSAPPRAAALRPRDSLPDLFGQIAVEESEPGPTSAHPKATGARNESSVLFTLDALTKKTSGASVAPALPKRADADLIGLGAPSSFGVLTAPDFSAPITEPPKAQKHAEAALVAPVTIGDVAPAPRKRRAAYWAVAVLGLLTAGALAVHFRTPPVLFDSYLPKLFEALSLPVPSSLATASADPAPPVPTEPEQAAPVQEQAAGSEVEATDASATTKPDEDEAPAAPPEPAPEAAPAAAAQPEAPRADQPAPREDEPAADPPRPPFDKEAAISALTSAAAAAKGCKQPDGPTGTGRATVTFAPSGRATQASVSGAFSGTAVGGCVAGLFRSAKIPAFSGDSVTVAKSFVVE